MTNTVRSAKMQFVLTGFVPDTGFRVFAFDGIAEDRSRTGFTVRADLALLRQYGIQMQDLPLLCRGLLERRDESEAGHELIYSESEMRSHADHLAAEKAEAQRKKAARRPPTNTNSGSAWRGTDGSPV
jgi:hypothetical protein